MLLHTHHTFLINFTCFPFLNPKNFLRDLCWSLEYSVWLAVILNTHKSNISAELKPFSIILKKNYLVSTPHKNSLSLLKQTHTHTHTHKIFSVGSKIQSAITVSDTEKGIRKCLNSGNLFEKSKKHIFPEFC